jgi:RecA-family ATPase
VNKPEPPVYISLSEVEARAINWVWEPYLARGVTTVLDGDPDQGKSFLAMHIAAKISSGGSLPGSGALEKGFVSYISGEDDPAFTIRPRIESMGGAAHQIRIQSRYVPFDENGIEKLRRDVEEVNPTLVVVDTMFAFLADGTNPSHPNEIRTLMRSIQDVAPNAAVLFIRHLRKLASDRAMQRGAGTMDIIGQARCGIVVAPDPENERVRVLAHYKCNLSPRAKSLTFVIEDAGKGKMPTFRWTGESELNADELLSDVSKQKSQMDEAIAFLERALGDGQKSAAWLEAGAKAEGISPRTLARARKKLGVLRIKKAAGWFARLPSQKK